MMNLEWWYTATIAFAAVGQTLFVLLYLRFPWYESVLGRALFTKALVFALLIDLAVVGHVWDWNHGQVWTVGMYGLAALSIWIQLTVFIWVVSQGSHETVGENSGV